VTRANQVASTDWLIDAVYAGDPPLAPEAALQTLISRLRNVLRRVEGLAVVTSPSGYRLEVGPEAVDVLVWEDLLRRAGQAAGDPRGAADLLAQALALWRGPAYGDFADEHFAAAEVARLSELHVVALENRAELLLRAGEPGEAVLPLSDLVRAHPFRERPVRLLMLAQHRLGRTVEALGTFQEFRARLADELGLDPSPPAARPANPDCQH
jgi:DNA-binding SARP family transcriptional activator